MTSVALKGLAGRKLRTLLTALAIVLGVAMISGTFVLTDTIHSAFDQIFRGSYDNTAAVISGKKVTDFATGGSPTVPQSLVAKVRELDGVESATGQIFNLNDSSDYGKLIGRDGKVIGSSGNPTFAFGLDPSRPDLLPLDIASGHWAVASDEVVIDSSSAKKEHFAVGDRIGVAVQGPTRYFRIVGTAKFGSVDSLGGATFAIFNVPTAQKLLHKEGQYDAILVSSKQGVSPESLTREIAPLLPANAQVETGEEQAKQNSKDISEFTKFLQMFLLAFGGIALFVGAFVIANTLSITVSQRTREFATLRTLGASRRQLLRSVLLEGFVTGLFASVTGLVLGLGLAKGLSAAMKALELDLPQTGTVFATRTVVVSILLGVIGTMLATIAPAIRATRVPPIAAVREGATLPKGRIARHRVLSSLLTVAVSVALLGYGLFAPGVGAGPRLLALAVGVLALFVGVAMGSSKLVRPLVKLVGAPSRRLGGTEGALANENANRNPARTAATAAALMIGLALVTAVATLGAGLRESDRAALRHQVVADYVVTSQNGWDPLSVAAGNAAAAAPGVELASAVRNEQSKILGDEARVDGIDPSTISSAYRYDWVQGSNATLASLGTDGAIVRKKFADKHHIAVGETIRVMNPAGRQSSFVVRGIYTQPKFGSIDPVVGSVAISQQAFAKTFDRPQNAYVFLNVKGGATDGETAALQKALTGYPEAKLHDRHGWVEERAKGIDKLLALLYVLLALSVIVSLFGMVNTLVLSVFERTREIGMLRAVGMSRRQTRRMITHESVITALIGAGLGLPLGVFLAGLITRALSDQGVSFTVPIVPLIAFAVVAVVAGLLASIAPARRAARLRPLEALKYE